MSFGCNVGEQNKFWAPKFCCNSCSRTLAGWLKVAHISRPFDVPMLWLEPRYHFNDCCFFMTKASGFPGFPKHKIEYFNIPSALRPVLYGDSMPVPKPQESYTLNSDSVSLEASPESRRSITNADPGFSTRDTSEPHLITEAELNSLVRSLDYTKTTTQLL